MDTPKDASPINGVVPPPEHRWKPGVSGNPKGRPPLGMSIREHLNALGEANLTEGELRKIARDKDQPFPLRSAAERALRMIEYGDLSDFAGLLRGENNLEDLRAMGVNTEVVRKFKKKTRKFSTPSGDQEEIVEQEIELHDRAGADFDRVVNQTAGNPEQHISMETTAVSAFAPNQEEIDRLIASAEQDGPDDNTEDPTGHGVQSAAVLSGSACPYESGPGEGEEQDAEGRDR